MVQFEVCNSSMNSAILIEQRWKDWNYDETVFPEIAAQALAETSPVTCVSPG